VASKRAPDGFTLQAHINAVANLLVFDRMAYESVTTHESVNAIKYHSANTESKNRDFNIGGNRH